MAIDLDKVKAAAEALGKLNQHEADFLKTYLLMSERHQSLRAVTTEPEKPEGRKLGPDPRGRYKCSLCDKVLPTKRGRGIHEKMHERQTAPEPVKP
jgi:hypothetical protein